MGLIFKFLVKWFKIFPLGSISRAGNIREIWQGRTLASSSSFNKVHASVHSKNLLSNSDL